MGSFVQIIGKPTIQLAIAITKHHKGVLLQTVLRYYVYIEH